MPGAVLNTSEGAVELELFAEDAPRTVENFTKLARDGFYNGLVFHRVLPDFEPTVWKCPSTALVPRCFGSLGSDSR